MKQGFRPPPIGRIFAPTPAARSRCLSSFIAIARQSLPLPLRYEPSAILVLAAAMFLVLGFFTHSLFRYGGTLIQAGWAFGALAFVAFLTQDKLVHGRSRARLIRQLDELRRRVGLDDAILPESLEFLESTAQEWERVEHALEAQHWLLHEPLRRRIYEAAHSAMEDVVVLECGSTAEAGLTDEEADQSLTATAANLGLLADAVDRTSSAIMSYSREEFEFNGISPDGEMLQLDSLEEALARFGNGKRGTGSAQSLH